LEFVLKQCLLLSQSIQEKKSSEKTDNIIDHRSATGSMNFFIFKNYKNVSQVKILSEDYFKLAKVIQFK
jgi:hypothetical protein